MLRTILVCLIAPLAIAGCANVEGRWISQSLNPALARDQFRFLRPTEFRGDFIRASFDLRDDQTYAAQSYYSGGMGFSSGGWSLVGDRLILRDNQYGTYTYRIKLSRDRDTLTIFQLIKGTDVELLLTRQDVLVPRPQDVKSPSWWDRLWNADETPPRRSTPRRVRRGGGAARPAAPDGPGR